MGQANRQDGVSRTTWVMMSGRVSGGRACSKVAVISFGTVVCAALLASCSKPSEKAQKRYDFLKEQHASLGEICSAGKDLVRSYSEERNAQDYKVYKAIVDVDCDSAERRGDDARYGVAEMQPDNMEIMAPAAAGKVKAPATSDDPVGDLIEQEAVDAGETGSGNQQGERR